MRQRAGRAWSGHQGAQASTGVRVHAGRGHLKEVFGTHEAWQGFASLDFKVCLVRGPKVSIPQEELAVSQHAPLSITEELRVLVQERS
eukprot:1968566-Lingulodinium_polyedra.AAC.1